MKTAKTILFVFVLYFLCLSYSEAQVGCGEDAMTAIQRNNMTGYDNIVRQINLNIKNYIAYNYPNGALNRTTSTANYVIPVVFHIIYPTGQAYGTGTNISYNQIQSQINALNAAYSRSYPSYNGQTHPAYAQNTNIQFCLAKTTMPSSVSFYNGPSGIENGVMRYADNTLTNHQMNNAGATALVNLTHPNVSYFPFSNYLNIWVVSSIATGGAGVTMGYAPKPLMGSYPLDGVVMRSDVIGDNSTGSNFALGYGLTQGKILAHEVGHYFNLYHIFEGGCAGANATGSATDACDLNGDMICDIEPCTTQNISCNVPIPNTCVATYPTGTSTLDMIWSYMSYADDDCMNTFTLDQTHRMWATLNTLRQNLWQTSNLAATGIIGTGSCISPFLMDNIRINTNNTCAGIPVQLSNPTLGNTVTSWNWTLAGGSITSSTSSSVTVTYNSPGIYWAKLTVSSGTTSSSDSLEIKVANCALDSSQLHRANWFFGNYSEIDFNTTPASVGNSAVTYTTMYQGYESTVSMSDKKGNLLFYTNCYDLWDNNHQRVNTIRPCLNLLPNGESSTPGVVPIPFPGDTSKYIIFSSPHTGEIYDSIYYITYDINTKIVSPKRGLHHALLPTAFSEPMTIVPHCNGRDYWVICRPFYSDPSPNKAFSVLITPAGPSNIGKVTVSNNILSNASGQFKSNSKGNKLIQADYNGSKVAYLYDFDASTGAVKNETPVNGLAPNLLGTGAIISSNDSLAYVIDLTASNGYLVLYQVNLQTLQTQTMSVPSGYKSLQMEKGPDNNIYLSQNDYMNTTIGRINNSNSWTNAVFAPSVLTFTNYPQNPFGGLPNYMDAKKGPEIAIDYLYNYVNCNTFHFSVDSCWQVYTAAWDFGDGTIATGLSVNHSYATTGSFTAKLVLSVGNYSLTPVIKNISVLSSTTTITGPPVICKGSTFINTYDVANITGATYNWNTSNAIISGPNTIHSVNVSASGTGVATLSVQIINGGCTSVATKTITIDTVPVVTFINPVTKICIGSMVTLTGSPAGGIFGGTGVSGNTFNSTTAGLGNQQVYYSYTNPNGCSNTTSAMITVNGCVGIEEQAKDNTLFKLYPNPNNGEFVITSEQRDMILTLTDELGQLLQTIPLNASNNYTAVITVLQNGIYFINSKTVRKKVVIIR